jgi:hypothetical protein
VLAPENLQQAGGSSTQGKRVTISYDESTAEDVAVPLAQSNGARTLKINVDLMLVSGGGMCVAFLTPGLCHELMLLRTGCSGVHVKHASEPS